MADVPLVVASEVPQNAADVAPTVSADLIAAYEQQVKAARRQILQAQFQAATMKALVWRMLHDRPVHEVEYDIEALKQAGVVHVDEITGADGQPRALRFSVDA